MTEEESLNVLLVEDREEDARTVVDHVKALPSPGIRVQWVTTMKDAVAALGETAFDAVLLDLGLPDATGLGNINKIQTVRPDVPTVVLTIMSEKAMGAEAIRRGADDYLDKTRVDGPLVLRSVRYAIERKNHQGERRRAQERLAQLRQERELNRLKTNFINSAAHELATPLTPLLLQLKILERSSDSMDERLQKSVKMAHRNADRLSTLIHHILSIARLDSGTESLNRNDVDIVSMVRGRTEMWSAEAGSASLEIVLTAPAECVADVDEDRLVDVVDSLIGNAVKFAPPKSRIRVTVSQDEENVLVEVRDRGIGLSPEQAARVFQPFAHVHKDLPPSMEGTGLSLYLAKGIVELHGGAVWVDSRGPGEGTTVGFRLPQAAARPRGELGRGHTVIPGLPLPAGGGPRA